MISLRLPNQKRSHLTEVSVGESAAIVKTCFESLTTECLDANTKCKLSESSSGWPTISQADSREFSKRSMVYPVQRSLNSPCRGAAISSLTSLHIVVLIVTRGMADCLYILVNVLRSCSGDLGMALLEIACKYMTADKGRWP